ncbi:MAG: citrate/2-methylcitrate synthase [Candidatus Thorarchaeota archaeon]|nr:citrate/2-methylcitrate synthase [Candidatus Thorarchaeota archaeon]
MEPISRIDPIANQLFFRGINAKELCKSYDFESITHLLLYGHMPLDTEHEILCQKLVDFRKYYSEEMNTFERLISKLEQISVELEFNLQDFLLAFIALVPLVVAKQHCEFHHKTLQEADSELNHIANFLWMTRGERAEYDDIRNFKIALILHMDDPDNPSLTTLHSLIKSGESVSKALLSTFQVHLGPLHHGAGTEAMNMLEDIRKSGEVHNFLQRRLEKGEKIYGLGHRIYRGMDPRAIVLREVLERRIVDTESKWIIDVIDRVSSEGNALLKEFKKIEAYPNVDLYNAAVYCTFGYHQSLNTGLFAVSRSVGWAAHILEWLSGY